MTFKQKIYEHYIEVISDKINSLQNALYDLSESVKNETKSTAGDKHETARAFLHIEQENLSKQLREALEQKAALKKINIDIQSSQIVKGSLLKTNKGYFFVSVALGKITVDDITIIALSPQSPLGIKLMGLKVADAAEINGITYMIEQID